jgi:hypothetical protein
MFPGIKFVPFRDYGPKLKRHSEMKPGHKLPILNPDANVSEITQPANGVKIRCKSLPAI